MNFLTEITDHNDDITKLRTEVAEKISHLNIKDLVNKLYNSDDILELDKHYTVSYIPSAQDENKINYTFLLTTEGDSFVDQSELFRSFESFFSLFPHLLNQTTKSERQEIYSEFSRVLIDVSQTALFKQFSSYLIENNIFQNEEAVLLYIYKIFTQERNKGGDVTSLLAHVFLGETGYIVGGQHSFYRAVLLAEENDIWYTYLTPVSGPRYMEYKQGGHGAAYTKTNSYLMGVSPTLELILFSLLIMTVEPTVNVIEVETGFNNINADLKVVNSGNKLVTTYFIDNQTGRSTNEAASHSTNKQKNRRHKTQRQLRKNRR